MRLMRLAFKPETAVPILALVFASGVCVALVTARVIWTGNLHYAFLVWNLFLAWLPLVFALLADDAHRTGQGSKWRFRGLAIAWLLFFPNAPYIFTDLIHLTRDFYSRFWVDLVLILAFALTGWVVGFLSLFLMQALVRRILGRIASWLFIAVVAGLSGFGIYVGRFLGFNSWDVVLQPLAVCRGIGKWAANPLAHSSSYAFPVLFAAFLFITYVMLYALTHLQHAPAVPSGAGRPRAEGSPSPA